MGKNTEPILERLAAELDGTVATDYASRVLYSTDASPYQRLPAGVAFPKHAADCVKIIQVCHKQKIPLIPRGAGTSLAGQCVGDGLIVDCMRYMNQIVAIDAESARVTVQPGVVLADLNAALKPSGLRFAPDPSTASRCNIGGMTGNNAWGIHAPRDGTTRDHVVRINAILSDGSETTFAPLAPAEWEDKLRLPSLEGEIYRTLARLVDANLPLIHERYPSCRGIPNNAGYPFDVLARQYPWNADAGECNLAPFLCGSEGTLAFSTEITLQLKPLPEPGCIVCAHFSALEDALAALAVALRTAPTAVELLDKTVLDLTRDNPEQRRNRFWIEGDPGAVLLIEIGGADGDRQSTGAGLIAALRSGGHGYAYPVIEGKNVERVWELRRAGLGLLMGKTSKRKPVTGFEDTAVAVSDLPAYVADVKALLAAHEVEGVFYGTASMGLLHIRPELDLTDASDVACYATLLHRLADLVVAYRGSISAKHGDGRLRSGLLEKTLGAEIVGMLREAKLAFDPHALLNPGKIIDAPPPDTDLRYQRKQRPAQASRYFNWGQNGDLHSVAARCNGAAVCLKSPGRGTMCPSYMASRDERFVTRGRANLLRHAFEAGAETGLDDPALAEALDLCLGCKGCRSECPANVDMARLKSEILQHRYANHGVPWRIRWLCAFDRLHRLASTAPSLAAALGNSRLAKHLLGFHRERALPALARQRFSVWYARRQRSPEAHRPRILLLNDPFTEYYAPEIGQAAVRLLEHLGFEVTLSPHVSWLRILLSAGLLEQAMTMLEHDLPVLQPYARDGLPIVGLEPSEILGYRDDIPALRLSAGARESAGLIARYACTFEELINTLAADGRLPPEAFDQRPRKLLLHAHCHQKSLIGMDPVRSALALIPNSEVTEIDAGCCGMAGFFGYEREHFSLSMQIAEQALFPALRARTDDAIVIATGGSCRQQIKDGVKLEACHTAQVFAAALGLANTQKR